MRKYLLKKFSTLILFFLMAIKSIYADTPKELLTKSSLFFDQGQYIKALELLNSINIRRDFDNSDDMKLAFKIRAIAFTQSKDIKHARETIQELYFLDSDYKFDPFDTPSSVIALAREEKSIIDEKNRQLALVKNKAQSKNNEESKINIPPTPMFDRETLILQPQKMIALFPFGFNHFYLNSPIRGGIYLSLQSLGFAINIAAFWWKQSYLEGFGATRLKDQNLLGQFETAQMFQYIGLGTLIFSYCVSIIDALIRLNNAST
jgi:hypothetical protein